MARQVRSVVKRYLKPEVKRVQRSLDEQSLNTLNQTAVAFSHSVVAQGTDQHQRVGNKIKAIGIENRIVMKSNATMTTYVRVLTICQQNPEVDITSITTNLFEDNTITNINTEPGLNAMYLPVNKERYQVIRDRVYRLSPTGAADGSDTVMRRYFIKMSKPIVYDSSSASDCSRNNIRTIFICSEAPDDVGAGAVVEISGITTLFYTDV